MLYPLPTHPASQLANSLSLASSRPAIAMINVRKLIFLTHQNVGTLSLEPVPAFHILP